MTLVLAFPVSVVELTMGEAAGQKGKSRVWPARLSTHIM